MYLHQCIEWIHLHVQYIIIVYSIHTITCIYNNTTNTTSQMVPFLILVTCATSTACIHVAPIKLKKKKHLIIVLDKVTKFLIFYSSLILTEIRGWGWAPSQPYVCGLAHNYYGSDAGISAPRL